MDRSANWTNGIQIGGLRVTSSVFQMPPLVVARKTFFEFPGLTAIESTAPVSAIETPLSRLSPFTIGAGPCSIHVGTPGVVIVQDSSVRSSSLSSSRNLRNLRSGLRRVVMEGLSREHCPPGRKRLATG